MNLYKHIEGKHKLDFKDKGLLMISTFASLRLNTKKSIGDKNEGMHTWRVSPKDHDRTFSSVTVHNKAPMINFEGYTPNAIKVEKGGNLNIYYGISDAFVFCTSTKLNLEYWKQFGKNDYFVITNPDKFITLLYKRLDYVFGLIGEPEFGFVTYDNEKSEEITTVLDVSVTKPPMSNRELCFTKERNEFREQTEYRMIFHPQYPNKIYSKILFCPELRECCEF